MATIDPVSDGISYRTMLFGLVGDRDPAVLAAQTSERLRAVVNEAGDALRVRPEPKEWSPLELVAHIADAELVCAARYRWIIAHDEPELIGYDQDLWVDRLHANDASPEEIVEVFDVLRRANIALWNRSTDAEKARVSHHAERGTESYADLFRMMAGHDLFHVDQIERTIAAVRR